MKILIDVGHPSFVHLFKNCAWHFLDRGDDVLFSARDKDLTYELLQSYQLPHKKMGKVASSIIGKVFSLFKFDFRLYGLMKKYKPDVVLSGASPYAAHVAGLLHIPHVLFDDTQNKEQLLLYKYCSQISLTPASFAYRIGKKHFTYKGFHELAYLHPKWFNPPAQEKKAETKKIVFRFISHNASHDTFIKGLTSKDKIYLVEELSKLGELVISSEVELPEELNKFRYKGKKDAIHDLIASADLLVGESATMASEAAMLGVPSLFFDPVGRCYTDELEKDFGLVFNFDTTSEAVGRGLKKAKSVLSEDTYDFKNARELMLKDNIDLSTFMIWLVEQHKHLSELSQSQIDKVCKSFLNA